MTKLLVFKFVTEGGSVNILHLGHFPSICLYMASAILLTYVQLSIINTASVLLDTCGLM